jgi:hypothetical protein
MAAAAAAARAGPLMRSPASHGPKGNRTGPPSGRRRRLGASVRHCGPADARAATSPAGIGIVAARIAKAGLGHATAARGPAEERCPADCQRAPVPQAATGTSGVPVRASAPDHAHVPVARRGPGTGPGRALGCCPTPARERPRPPGNLRPLDSDRPRLHRTTLFGTYRISLEERAWMRIAMPFSNSRITLFERVERIISPTGHTAGLPRVSLCGPSRGNQRLCTYASRAPSPSATFQSHASAVA